MLIVEFQMDSPLLKGAFQRAPDVTVRDDERYTCDEATHYFFWAEGGDLDAFEAGMDADPSVSDRRTIGETPTRRLYRVSTTSLEPDPAPVATWCELDLVLLDATGTHGGWTLRMRFPDRDALDRYRAVHSEWELAFRLHSIHREDGGDEPLAPGVTEPQYEALRAVYEAGYFDVPRTVTQSEIANQLGISSQSLSERIRRGTATLIEANLLGNARGT